MLPGGNGLKVMGRFTGIIRTYSIGILPAPRALGNLAKPHQPVTASRPRSSQKRWWVTALFRDLKGNSKTSSSTTHFRDTWNPSCMLPPTSVALGHAIHLETLSNAQRAAGDGRQILSTKPLLSKGIQPLPCGQLLSPKSDPGPQVGIPYVTFCPQGSAAWPMALRGFIFSASI